MFLLPYFGKKEYNSTFSSLSVLRGSLPLFSSSSSEGDYQHYEDDDDDEEKRYDHAGHHYITQEFNHCTYYNIERTFAIFKYLSGAEFGVGLLTVDGKKQQSFFPSFFSAPSYVACQWREAPSPSEEESFSVQLQSQPPLLLSKQAP